MTTSPGISGPPEPLALTVCRLALDPVRGRLRHPHQVGIAVRAALFTELAGAGRLAGSHWPEAVGGSDTGDPLADALHRAVEQRRRARWKRWYSHIAADRTAATDALISSGRWRLEAGRLVDRDPAATVVEQQRIGQLLAAGQPAETLEQAVLVLLVGGFGAGTSRPAPKRSRRLAKALLRPHLRTAGAGGDAAVAALDAAFVAMRRANPVPFWSR